MTILFLVIAILTSGLAGNIYKRLSDKSESPAMSAMFPMLWYFPLAVVFCIAMAASQIPWQILTQPALLWPALGSGLGLALAATILLESMKRNSLSVSVILVNLNFMIPVVLSWLLLREETGWIQLAGTLLSAVVIVLLNLKQDGGAVTKDALVLPCIACIANGMVNFCIKLHQNQLGSAYLNGFYMLMYLSGGFFCLVLWSILQWKTDKKAPVGKATWLRIGVDALCLGGCNGICFYASGLLAGRMNAAAQFTVITAASVALSLVVGFVFQKERLRFKTVLSFVFCLIAILFQAFSL